jgi:hypothetical protein
MELVDARRASAILVPAVVCGRRRVCNHAQAVMELVDARRASTIIVLVCGRRGVCSREP